MCLLSPRETGGVSEMRNELAAGSGHEECVWKQGWYEGRVISVCYTAKGLIDGVSRNHSKEQNCHWDPRGLVWFRNFHLMEVSCC